VSFNEFGGREVKVGAVDSNCEPRLQMVSRFEFLAFTCGGTGDRTRLKAYGMDGHETWEDSLGGTFGIPEFAFAPAAGRFAMSRIAASAADMADIGLGSVLPSTATQEVRVYQTESGDLLLKVPTSPVTRFAENFDLSEDGMVAAVIANGAVEVYKLQAPSAKDLKDLEEARNFSPPTSDAPVRFAKLEKVDDAAEGHDLTAAESPLNAGGGSGSGGGNAAAASAGNADPGAGTVKAADEATGGPDGGSRPASGDVSRAGGRQAPAADGSAGGEADQDGATARRRPPTLLGPGEKVETVKGSGDAVQPPKAAQASPQSR